MQKYHMMQRARIAVYLTILGAAYEISDWEMTSDGKEIKRASSTGLIEDIRMISYSDTDGGLIVSAVAMPLAPGEGREMVQGWKDGLDALREAWCAAREPRAVRVELDGVSIAQLGAQVARSLHDEAQAEMSAELGREEAEAIEEALRTEAMFGGAQPPEAGELLALLAAPLDGDGQAHFVRHVGLLGEAARIASARGGEVVGVYLSEREAHTALGYLVDRGFKMSQCLLDVERG